MGRSFSCGLLKIIPCISSSSTADSAPQTSNPINKEKKKPKNVSRTEKTTKVVVQDQAIATSRINNNNNNDSEHSNFNENEATNNASSKVEWVSGDRKEVTEIKWQIKDFLTLCEMKDLLRNETCIFNTGLSLNSPTRWCFNLQRMKQENNIGLFLKRLKPLPFKETILPSHHHITEDHGDTAHDVDEPVYIHYECIIKRSGFGDAWIHRRTCIPKFETGQRLGFRKLFTLDELKASEQDHTGIPLLSDDGGSLNLEILFTLHMQSSDGITKSELDLKEKFSIERSEVVHAKILRNELGSLLRNGHHSDTIIIMEDDKTFAVHKALLAARSPVFAAMFHSGMRESQTGIVRIQDVSSTAMENILSYIYCGSVNSLKWDNIKEIEDLIYAADKYSLLGLRDLCDKTLISGCTHQNALDLFLVAQTHSLTVAVADISFFMKMNANKVFGRGTLGT